MPRTTYTDVGDFTRDFKAYMKKAVPDELESSGEGALQAAASLASGRASAGPPIGYSAVGGVLVASAVYPEVPIGPTEHGSNTSAQFSPYLGQTGYGLWPAMREVNLDERYEKALIEAEETFDGR